MKNDKSGNPAAWIWRPRVEHRVGDGLFELLEQ